MADMNLTENLKEGYILDYISGLPVKETPEEVEAVQPFSKATPHNRLIKV